MHVCVYVCVWGGGGEGCLGKKGVWRRRENFQQAHVRRDLFVFALPSPFQLKTRNFLGRMFLLAWQSFLSTGELNDPQAGLFLPSCDEFQSVGLAIVNNDRRIG